jgi:hypothetical protein
VVELAQSLVQRPGAIAQLHEPDGLEWAGDVGVVNRSDQRRLVGEYAVEQPLGHATGIRQPACLGRKPVFGKELEGFLQDQGTAFRRGKAHGGAALGRRGPGRRVLALGGEEG